MSTFRFANPDASHALWFVGALIVLLCWLEWRRGDVLARFVSPVMQRRLVHRQSRLRRWLSIVCLGLSGVSLVVALMRPQWGLTYHQMPRVGAQIMVCLDVSKSMLAEDTAPNRLARAKAELTDLLSYLQGDQVGLIAFAGRATVLCPLTPDFGFFKLILDGAGPHSVGRGGTRLEEPVRKALEGFRTESDVSRILLLITDGEDHDSHPLDAAKAAAERGVKILAIGFGDEAGSEIYYTDPDSGARTQIRDSDGRPVISRLDRKTLCDMALATDGAYIPAGTGALDLKSIYDAHIAPLVRGKLDDRGHAVRRDMFQWAVLAGFVFLVASMVIGSGSVKSELRSPPRWTEPDERGQAKSAGVSSSRGQAAAVQASLFCLIVLAASPSVSAQQKQPVQPTVSEPSAVTANGVQKSPTKGARGVKSVASEPVDPRRAYNNALAYLDTDFDRAEQMLTRARRESSTDGDVRFRATYNLGWVEVKRADKLLGDKPEEALSHLRRAADWFRDAVRLRPGHADARHNLEVVLRRVLELADALAKKDQRSLAQRLDELIQTQRRLVGSARQLVDRVSAEQDANAADRFRSDFRQLAVQERKILSDGQALSQDASRELDTLSGKKDEQKTPQEKVRAAQLTNLLHYANRASQRLGQARSQMRRGQAERSFRRAAAGLTELKRARDQLRGPVEVLDVILADALSLAQFTSLKTTTQSQLLAPPPQLPASTSAPKAGEQQDRATDEQEPLAGAAQLEWLTQEFLEDDQQSVTERTAELTTRLQAAVEEQKTQPAGPQTAEQQRKDAAKNDFLAMVGAALPLLTSGQKDFESAGAALAGEKYGEAAGKQLEAIAALRAARERFLDLRGLIELAYAHETEIQQLIAPPGAQDHPDAKNGDKSAQTQTADQPQVTAGELRARAQFAAEEQTQNLERGERIARLIDEGLDKLPQKPAGEQGATGNPKSPGTKEEQQAAAKRQQLELARQLLGLARDEMSQAAGSIQESMGRSSPTEKSQLQDDQDHKAPDTAPPDLKPAREHVARAVENLESLRRLFFSVIEHLRETAQRQAEVNDDTEHVAALAKDEDPASKTGPLSVRQRELQSITEQIAQVLGKQAQQQPAAGGQQKISPQQQQQLQQVGEQITKAAKLVAEGGLEMRDAAEQLSPEKNDSVKPAAKTDDAGSQKDAKKDNNKPPRAEIALDTHKFSFDAARKHQDAALQKLVEALAILQPPRPPQQQNDNQQKQDQKQQSQQKKQQQDQQMANADPSHMLQAVRDREAQRRRDRDRKQRVQPEPVDKDW